MSASNITKWDIALWTGAVVFTLALCFGSWIGGSYMEAKTYTELTGMKVTTWQAMFVELRVIEPGVRP